MERRKRSVPEFTSALSDKVLIFVGVGLVLHIFLLPRLLVAMIEAGRIGEVMGNFLLYAIMAVYVVAFTWKFLRRDFDPLADRPLDAVFEILEGYFLIMCLNLLLSLVLSLFEQEANPNNEAVLDMAAQSSGPATAMSVFLAPIVEEVLFRAGIFGFLRKYNRAAAYVATAIVFALYHLWGFILLDARNLVFLIQYIPAALVLCRVYEQSNTIWCPIGLHMLVNYVSLQAAGAAGKMA